MDLSAAAIAPRGAGTQWEVGGPAPAGAMIVTATEGVIAYEPRDLTITVGAAISFAELDQVLAEQGQECALDPRERTSTIGGILACGLSGLRRLRHGPLRDHVLEVRMHLADGRMIKGGGPTVKNVTGYDIPRLFVGSLGTLGVLLQTTLRCQPRSRASQWFEVPAGRSFYRPSARVWDGRVEHVLLEGRAVDVRSQSDGLTEVAAPQLPGGAHRGRISVAPAQARAVVQALDDDVRALAELGVGTVHVAADSSDALARARAVATSFGGWMLREAGGDPRDDGFGCTLPNRALMQRIKHAFDPDVRMNPGRLPL
ncbi:MAG TPA: FAD-binding protein [Acidimicrobiia bacterium]|nr:FAD-binding protein [Acidimicrobiia bacterium]